jgi:uncharacterized protein YkwD
MANPTAQEQELLELINRMRLRPQEELEILLDAADPTKQSYDLAIKKALDDFKVNIDTLKTQWSKLTKVVAPVAWSSELNQASRKHNDVMIKYDQQSHYVGKYDRDGQLIEAYEADFGQRLTDANYDYKSAAENIYAYGRSVLHTHAGFAIDWGSNPDGSGIQNPAGHRDAILSSDVREVGISINPENDSNTQVGPLVVTQNFGNRSALDKKAWLVGVAFEDANKDGWYQAGEGLNDVSIQVTGIEGTTFTNKTKVAEAGGYQELLDPGKYRVDFIRNDKIVKTQTTSIESKAPSNVKLDLVIPFTRLDIPTPNTSITEPSTPVENTATPTTTQTIGNSKQVVADGNGLNVGTPITSSTPTSTPVENNVNLKTTSSTSNLLDFRTDDSTSATPQDLTGKTIAINFTGVGAEAAYRNYAGFYRVEDTQGTVIDTDGKSYAPKDSGYLNAALRRSQVTNEGVQLDRNGLSNATNLKGGYIYAPFLIANGRVDDVLNSKNGATAPQVYFDYMAANADGFQHTKSLGANKFGFEDLYGGGDKDYNDLVFTVNAKVA